MTVAQRKTIWRDEKNWEKKATFGQFAGRNMRFKKLRQGARPSRARAANSQDAQFLLASRS